MEVVEKLRWRELGRRQELSREGRRCAKHQFSGRNARLLQRHTPEAEEDPRRLQLPMHSLNHAVGLRLVGGRHDMLDAQGATEGRQRRQSELGALVQGYSGRDPKTGDPLDEGVDASCCGGILDGIGGGPMC